MTEAAPGPPASQVTPSPSTRREGWGGGPSRSEQLVLELDGYEGPIDLLLSLAREQKVDLGKISILALADQYLAFIARQRSLSLEIAADYLVMAAWLAYLKSRLLLPQPPPDEEPGGIELAAHRAGCVLARRARGARGRSGPGLRAPSVRPSARLWRRTPPHRSRSADDRAGR